MNTDARNHEIGHALPWVAVETFADDKPLFDIVDANGLQLAIAVEPEVAPLFVAAPDLLARVERLYQYIVSLRELNAVTGPSIDTEIQESAALILKATKGGGR